MLPLILRKVAKELIRVPATKFLLLNCICFPILQIFPNNFQIKQPSKSLLFKMVLFFWVKQLFTEKHQTNLRSHKIAHPKPHTTKSTFLESTFLEIGFTYIRKNAISYKPSWSSLLPTEFVFTHSLSTDNSLSVALELPQIRSALCFLRQALFFCSSGKLQPHSQKQCLVC